MVSRKMPSGALPEGLGKDLRAALDLNETSLLAMNYIEDCCAELASCLSPCQPLAYPYLMPDDGSRADSSAAPQISAGFPATHWSVVLTAGHDSSSGARDALEQLCRAYWYPLYCYVRRRVGRAADAEDLTQSFFAHLLERNALAKVSQDKGRFRSFLLAALHYFLADEWDKVKAQKRGGGCVVVSWNEVGAEERYQREGGHELTAEQLYERRWAMAVLDRASIRLQEEFAAAGKTALGKELRGLQENAAEAEPYVEVAARLVMPVNTLKSHVHRYRQRFRELLCEEVAQTVATPTDVADELRRMIVVVGGAG